MAQEKLVMSLQNQRLESTMDNTKSYLGIWRDKQIVTVIFKPKTYVCRVIRTDLAVGGDP